MQQPIYTQKNSLVERMPTSILKEIAKDVLEKKRLSFDQATILINYPDSEPLQLLADYRRQQICGEEVYFASTIYIHPTNLCELSCPMCSYYAKPGWKSAWYQTPQEAFDKIKPYLDQGANEVHIVGGLWKDTNLDYYQDLFQRIKSFNSKLHIKALTPVEYDYLARLHNITVQEVLEKMYSFGLDSIPGGGAEILDDKIRKQIAPQKIDSNRFLQIHQFAHEMNIPTNITMLYGHVEKWEDIFNHLIRIREQQDISHGFQTFIPLKYHEENNALGKRKNRLHPKDAFKVYAISRLLLDNIANIKTLWNYIGPSNAQKALLWGVNDLGSTAFEEKIIKMAGSEVIQMDASGIKTLATQVGRTAKQVHSGHRSNRNRFSLPPDRKQIKALTRAFDLSPHA